MTETIIRYQHECVCHEGRGTTHNHIRSSGIWITGGIDGVSRVINRCVVCRKLRAAPQVQKMADLPKDRLESSPPFSHSAVYCFGPWRVRDRGREAKRNGIFFTCLASRVVHLETANTTDASSFVNAYRRFVGRRDPVRQLRSDRGWMWNRAAHCPERNG